MFRKFKKSIILLFFMLVAGVAISASHANAVSIKNNVSTSANTGGNLGESIETGSASAATSIKTQGSKSVSQEIVTDIKVRANGIEKEVHTQGEQDISVQVEARDSSESKTASTEKNFNDDLQDQSFDTLTAKVPLTEPKKNKSNFLVKTEKFFNRLTDWLKNLL